MVLTYGSGWGTVVFAQGQGDGDAAMPPEAGDAEANGLQQLPTVDLGGGVEAQEISTPIGSGLSWSADGPGTFWRAAFRPRSWSRRPAGSGKPWTEHVSSEGRRRGPSPRSSFGALPRGSETLRRWRT